MEVIRYRFLFWVMVIATVLVSVTVPFNFQSQDWRQWSRSFITIGTFLSLLIYLRKTGRYKVVAHIAHGISVFVILVNTYFIFQIFNAISLLIFFLNVLFTYFMLGYRWGTVYSLVNFLPMIIYVTLLEGGARISLMIEPKDVTNQEFLINFVGILLINIYLMFTLVRAFQTSGQRYADMLARQKQMNQQLSKKEQDLAYANIEMKRANIALKKANRSAEASSRAKSEFLSTMSHEIRTPMNAVIGMTHILLDENPREEQKTHLNLLKFSAENLLVLINDILDFNKIEAGKIEFENIEFNLVELVHKIGRGLEPKAQERNLDFRIAIDPKITWTLMGDPTRLSQVLTNLLSNAIKFTKKGHIKVWVALKGERENTATVLFSVEDTGIGIPTAKIKQVFESFSQASSDTTRKFGGTGLGLAIVKRLLELQGSEIQVESQFGQGSRFFFEQAFTIERSKPLFSTTERKVPSNERDLKGKSILLVEDNPSNVLVARKFLERWNAKLSLAENGELAMEALRDQTFDLILMDLQMPLLDGYQATMLIRSLDDESKRNIPIIALTASAMVEIQDRVYAVGMNDYVSKPFNPNELYQKIVKNLEKNQAV
ncbi:MAG TPA: hypothetical protein DCE41_27630 [Cytophagales bacterium]|nr:hypothetical protein [Cytophagales bacterium]